MRIGVGRNIFAIPIWAETTTYCYPSRRVGNGGVFAKTIRKGDKTVSLYHARSRGVRMGGFRGDRSEELRRACGSTRIQILNPEDTHTALLWGITEEGGLTSLSMETTQLWEVIERRVKRRETPNLKVGGKCRVSLKMAQVTQRLIVLSVAQIKLKGRVQ